MTGYMTKLIGNVFEGELVNGAAIPIPNGRIMVQGTGDDKDKLVLPAADSGSKFVCKEVGAIFDGVTAYRFVVDTLKKRYYFVECNFDSNDSLPYDNRDYTTDVGKYLRAHPLQVGEEFWTNNVPSAPSVGAESGVTAQGLVG